jgi:hypothetical protein
MTNLFVRRGIFLPHGRWRQIWVRLDCDICHEPKKIDVDFLSKVAARRENMGSSFKAASQQAETLTQISTPRLRRRPAELPDSLSKMVSKLVDHRVDDGVGPFAAGHRVVQDRPKTIGPKVRLREALSWQMIFVSTALLVWHGSLRIHGDVVRRAHKPVT